MEYNVGGQRIQRSKQNCNQCPVTYNSSDSYKCEYREVTTMHNVLNQIVKKNHSLYVYCDIEFLIDGWMDGYSWSFRFCLFVWSFYSHLRIFHSNGDVIIADEGLQIARHSAQSNVGSLACHTYCGAKHPFIMVICELSYR